MKPPTRPRQDQSQSLIEKETVFKIQGQSYNMDDLIKSTLLKEPVLESMILSVLCLCLLLGHCGNGVMFFFHTALAPQFAHLDVLRLYVSLHCLV
jgi:hypothetical protein